MDWKKIVRELIESGMTQGEISSRTGISQSQISFLLNGKRGDRLAWGCGEALLKLHRKVMRQQALRGARNSTSSPTPTTAS